MIVLHRCCNLADGQCALRIALKAQCNQQGCCIHFQFYEKDLSINLLNDTAYELQQRKTEYRDERRSRN